MAVDTRELIQSAMMLREGAPAAWDSFVVAMRRYSATVNAEMIRADPDKLLRAQGMAIMANEIAMLLHKAPEEFQKHREAMLQQNHKRNTQ
jgi:hypothetical protein